MIFIKNKFIDVKKCFRVDVMGQPYKIKFISDDDDLLEFNGLSITKNKEILILNSYDNPEDFEKTILHELLHCYFYECGMPYYCADEKLIYWLEHNFFKILTSFNNVLTKIYKK